MLSHPQYRTLRCGESYYLQDWQRPLGVPRFSVTVRREPWEIVAFLPRVNALNGMHYARGAHTAVVRSLRTGRTQSVGVWMLRQAEELDLQRDWIN